MVAVSVEKHAINSVVGRGRLLAWEAGLRRRTRRSRFRDPAISRRSEIGETCHWSGFSTPEAAGPPTEANRPELTASLQKLSGSITMDCSPTAEVVGEQIVHHVWGGGSALLGQDATRDLTPLFHSEGPLGYSCAHDPSRLSWRCGSG